MRPMQRIAILALLILGLSGSGCEDAVPERIRTITALREPPRKPAKIQGKKILLVQSYHAGYPWGDAIARGVESRLAGSGVDLKIYYMDTKRRTDEPWKVQAGNLAMREVERWKPDLVIAADDNAQEYFGKYFVDGRLPLVFCGVNGVPSQYGYPASNITGVIERPFFKETLAFLQKIRSVRKIVILSCADNTSLGAINFIKEQVVDCEVETHLINDFDEWKAAVERYNRRFDALGVYVYHTLKEKGGLVSLPPDRVMQWTVEHASIPTMGYFKFAVEDGLLLGVVESGEEQGEKAAEYALEILGGTPIASLPIRKAHCGRKMFNVQTAKRLEMELPKSLRYGVQFVPPAAQ